MDHGRASFERHCQQVRERLARRPLPPAGPDSVSWRINREIVVVAGWGRAILLQFAHPLVAAGVDHHSAFRGSLLSSLKRLRSTVGAMLALTFGDEEEVVRAAAGINTIHDRVVGRLGRPAGRFGADQPYSAHDPELLRWVHATLLESVPMVYELLVGPLSPGERDRYCTEAAVMEPLLDIPEGLLPRSTAQLDAYMRQMLESGAIVVTDTSRTLARSVLFPPNWRLLWPFFRPVQLLTIGLLPPAIRAQYGFAWDESHARALSRWVATIRRLHNLAPRVIRHWPSARRATSTASSASGSDPCSARPRSASSAAP
jgi:uncharacterized protein (DUF2236 family)